MAPEIQLILFSTLLSLAIAYAWWVKFRVWMLREDLFAIRDRLWDKMSEDGQLDDPGHRHVRNEINALIRIAPLFSVLTVFSIVLEGAQFDLIQQGPFSGSVQKARDEVVQRITRYLLLHTLFGLIVFVLIVFAFIILVRVRYPLRMATERFAALTNQIFGSVQVRDESYQIESIASRALSNI
jgi:hypothetical protein